MILEITRERGTISKGNRKKLAYKKKKPLGSFGSLDLFYFLCLERSWSDQQGFIERAEKKIDLIRIQARDLKQQLLN